MELSKRKTGSEVRAWVGNPDIAEGTWLALAIASVAILIVFVGAAAVWVFFPQEATPETMRNKAAAVTPFLAASAAATTFFTVTWRGAISARQADEQRRQNDASDEANVALLFEKGVDWLRKESRAEKALGATLLKSVALGTNDHYAEAAIDELAGQLPEVFTGFMPGDYWEPHPALTTVQSALERGARLGRLATRRIVLDLTEDQVRGVEFPDLMLFPGLPPGTYRGITFDVPSTEVDPANLTLAVDKAFDGCVFKDEHDGVLVPEIMIPFGLIVDGAFDRNRFVNLQILAVVDFGQSIEFRGCSFSDADIQLNDDTRMRFEHCFYTKGDPSRNYDGSALDLDSLGALGIVEYGADSS